MLDNDLVLSQVAQECDQTLLAEVFAGLRRHRLRVRQEGTHQGELGDLLDLGLLLLPLLLLLL